MLRNPYHSENGSWLLIEALPKFFNMRRGLVISMTEEMELTTIREKIDEVDRELVILLLKRFELVSKIPEVKKKRNLKTVDAGRESYILSAVTKLAEENGLKGSYMRNIFRAIIDNCITFEEKICARAARAND